MVEGELLKWTNYLNGWQTRWFSLRDGVLSYFNSADEVHAGCRGSFKVSALEITVSSIDPKRFILTTPSGQTLYLRTKHEGERQFWLKALCSGRNTPSDGGDVKPLPENSMGKDLQIYYDILMQEALLIKAAVIHESNPDIEKLKEGNWESESLREQVLSLCSQVKESTELAIMPAELRKDLTLVIQRLSTKFVLDTMSPEDAVNYICEIQDALKTGMPEVVEAVKTDIEQHLDSKGVSVQGEVVEMPRKPTKKRLE